MTESPAMSSQKNSDVSASGCETIIQIRIGLREEGFASKITLLELDFSTGKINFTPERLYSSIIKSSVAVFISHYSYIIIFAGTPNSVKIVLYFH